MDRCPAGARPTCRGLAVNGPTRATRRLIGIALVVAAGAACSEPALPESAPPAEESEDVLTDEEPEPAPDELVDAIEDLTATVAAAQAELEAAADGGAAARSSATAALELLLDDPDGLSPTSQALF